ncbi:Hypothetical predicted protein [Paramuricea clavata]|uniref:Uncharacterized protein n=1 Tax=Paramuricea clavata TaxID=317549 RepID=A0A6S7FS92_PARCT|nr:Hypothetical predicted protein [Paramuricea clavata]
MILTVIDIPETSKSPVSTMVVATGETATIQDVREKNKEKTKNAKCFKIPKTMLEESLIHEIEYDELPEIGSCTPSMASTSSNERKQVVKSPDDTCIKCKKDEPDDEWTGSSVQCDKCDGWLHL